MIVCFVFNFILTLISICEIYFQINMEPYLIKALHWWIVEKNKRMNVNNIQREKKDKKNMYKRILAICVIEEG